MTEAALRTNVLTKLARDPADLAATVAALALLTVAAAWAFQMSGLTPCELCLRERIPFYAGLAVALATVWAARRPAPLLARTGFAILILIFALSTVLAAYHAGVEWKFWPGPSECSGSVTAPAKVDDFLQQLKHVTVVRCDAAALRIFGLSLAGWNVVISALLTALALRGLIQARASQSRRVGLVRA